VALDRERQAQQRLERVGLACFAVAALLSIALRITEVSWMAATWHWITLAYDHARQGSTFSSLPPAPVRPSWGSAISTFLILPLEVIALALVLTFQHRAATVAKALGLRTRLSPTFGVVGWFIPGANVALPLVAWLDLLPPRHPQRRLLWGAWLLLLGATLMTVGIYAAASSSGLAVGLLSALQLLSFAAALACARTGLRAVGREHLFGATSAGVFEARNLRAL
jgi:hypothetical protein